MKRRIGLILIGGFMVVIVMLIVVASYAVIISQRFLTESIGASTVFSADDMLGSMSRTLEHRMEETRMIMAGAWYRQQIEASNREFDRLGDRSSILARRAGEWAVAAPAGQASSYKQILDSPISEDLRRIFINLFMRETGARYFNQVFITNKYGAVIASTGGRPAYRQDDQAWWKETRDSGEYLGQVMTDAQTGQPMIVLGVSLLDQERKFAGALFALLNLEGIVQPTVISSKKYDSTQFKLFTVSGRMLYSTKAFQIMEDVSSRPYFTGINAASGWFIGIEGGRETLFAYIRSTEVVGSKVKDWILLLGHDVDEVLKPSFMLRNNIILVSLIPIAVGILIALLISASITRPVRTLTEAAAQISQGNLSVDLVLRRKDELGSLAESFSGMNDSLRSMVAITEKIAGGDLTVEAKRRSEGDIFGISLENMLKNLKGQVGSIMEASRSLAASTSQIFSSTTQLAAAATESATAVSQTTVTVEEVKQTAHLANEKAGLVSQRSQQTVQVVKDGREAVERTREVMDRIKTQMESMAQNILSLSEQSQAIGEIIMSVTDLADQSRLLAVNAAIEASRAGEQGRGFAVVAQEIKNLSEQSKKATSQVRTLLNDVQKAVNAVVLSMEQGSKAMDSGQEQAIQADEAIRELAQSIEESANAATQIAASSHQQLVGMDQVALAMENIKQAAGENVQSTKQLESEVQNLYDLSQKLKQTAEFYKL